MDLKINSMRLNSHTIGRLTVDGQFYCYTLELPWLENACNISCIPSGSYIIKMIDSPKFGSCYQLSDVCGRTHILIHSGNTVDDIEGCILLGTSCGVLNGKEAVLNSKSAINSFHSLLGGDEHTIEIVRN
jgi:hypothetical protein